MDEGLPIVPGYEVLEQLAAGGRAEIYLAKDRAREGELVAVKFLKKEDIDDVDKVQAFMDEVELSKLLVHPTIVRVFNGEFAAGLPYLVMEFVDGITVYELVARARKAKKRIPFGVAAYLAAMVADALDYAHTMRGPDGSSLNLVHRDVSAVNIMITFDGAVKLLDFGIARSKISSVRTAPGIIKGKLDYLSPEQCTGGRIDALTDIYSLGVVLFELITNRRPFEETNLGRQFEKVSKGDRPKVHKLRPDVPPRLERIIDRAMAVKRKRRYPSARAMHEDLRAFMEKLPERPTSSTMAQLLSGLVPEQLTKVQEAYGPSDTTAVNEADVVASLLRQKMEGPPSASPSSPPQPVASYPPPVAASSQPPPLVAASSQPPPPPFAAVPEAPPTVAPLQPMAPARPRTAGRLTPLIVLAVMVLVAITLGMMVVWLARWRSSPTEVHVAVPTEVASDAAPTDAAQTAPVGTDAETEPEVLLDAAPVVADAEVLGQDGDVWFHGDASLDGAVESGVLDFTTALDGGVPSGLDGGVGDAGSRTKGYLTVDSRRRAMLFVGSKRIGLTPVERLELDPGRYRLKVRARRGLRRRWVTIRAGREEKVQFTF